ncbi:Panacea domain-containing protein [Sphingobacterium sp. JUb56]|uniref:Panacea domain-containing protein n=1 Tax=Sphingobacterium sp. JUb56 TaxID=2587145 RepID=UPI00162150AD|nr:Panacea domain-containing protein [Sphingobacterium sp. JUb56]MBB2951966.1 putative phage-associated protein [Sphingobacterium sp. JUb56]
MNFKIDRSKSINSMLYIIGILQDRGIDSDIHKVMKLMYFADREHLVTYGFPITGDTYLKLQYGPVPSFSNYVANDEITDFKGIISRSGKILNKNVEPDLDDLSESEIECLENSVKTFSSYNFTELTDISHDFAYNTSEWDISYEKIAEEGGANEDMKAFIKAQLLNDNITFC